MALSMSIAIDPERADLAATPETGFAVEGAPPSASTQPLPPSAPAPPPVAAPAAPATPSAEREPAPLSAERRIAPRAERLALPIDYTLSAYLEVSSGFSPATAAGGGSLQLRGRHGHFSIALQGRIDAPSGMDAEGGRVESGLAALVLAPCVHLGPASGCVLGMAGEVWASSSQVSDARSDVAMYGAVGARLGLDWPEQKLWAISLHADALRPLTRISIHLNQDPVWSAPAIAFALGTGATVRF